MIFFKPLYYITDVKDHSSNKERILTAMARNNCQLQNIDVKEYYSFVSNSDYTLAETRWFQFALSPADQHRYQKFVYDKFKQKDLGINAAWYNQYYANSGAEHAYHGHYSEEEPNDLTNIYFVELKDKSLRTVIKHPKTGKEIIPRVKEGQILSFDAKLQHKSPPNLSITRKTVISFNVRFL